LTRYEESTCASRERIECLRGACSEVLVLGMGCLRVGSEVLAARCGQRGVGSEVLVLVAVGGVDEEEMKVVGMSSISKKASPYIPRSCSYR
jgi:hypothetical protein